MVARRAAESISCLARRQTVSMPLDRWIGLALPVPVVTLTARRMLSMTSREWLEMGLILLLLLLLLM